MLGRELGTLEKQLASCHLLCILYRGDSGSLLPLENTVVNSLGAQERKGALGFYMEASLQEEGEENDCSLR